ncbi:MAG: precorrin-2 C(20)-methyltransferase [Selenomonadaceae bacterium]|nr:precorrin-2 C(20)-methyltransferase [Selenomonadaceae bacterium]
MENESVGIFYGIGVGPGDPELLTVKAINAIKNADIIIAPKTEKKEGSVALNIAKPYLRDDVEIIYQTFPMVTNFEEFHKVFEENEKEILKFLNAGKNVAFLTLGDPMFYSTYIYIFRLLKNSGVKIETVPGVPAFLAISSYINRPLVYGGDILTVIPATADREKIIDALKISDTAVLMKVYKNFHEVAEILKNENMSEDAVLVSRCGLNDEKIIENIDEHKDEQINYLSTILTRRNSKSTTARLKIVNLCEK